MQIGELFVELGIKGADKAVEAVSSVRNTLSSVTSTSLETKAAIIGVFYELQRLTSQSNAFGMSLQQFTARTGLTGDFFQRWDYLMRQGGVSTEETMQSIEGLQQAIAKIATSPTSSRGLTAIANILGQKNFDFGRIRDMGYLLDKLREYARHNEVPPDIRQMILTGLNLTPRFAAELSKSGINLNKIRPSEIYNSHEQNALAKMFVDWSNLGNQWAKMFGRLNIEFGPRFIKDLQGLLPIVRDLVSAFAQLAETIKLMKGVGMVFKGWGEIFKLMTDAVKTINKEGISGLLPSTQQIKFLAKDYLDVPMNAAPSTRNVNNTFNTTVSASGLGSGAELADEIAEHHARKVAAAMRQIPQPGF